MGVKTYIAHSALSHARSHKYVTKVFKNGRWRYVYNRPGLGNGTKWNRPNGERKLGFNNFLNADEFDPNTGVLNEKGVKKLNEVTRLYTARSNKSLPTYARQQHKEAWALKSGKSGLIKRKKGSYVSRMDEW